MDALSRLTVLFLLNALWQIALVTAIAMLLDRWLRPAPARYRHLLWVMALAAAIALPLMSGRTASGVTTRESASDVDAQAKTDRAPAPLPGLAPIHAPNPTLARAASARALLRRATTGAHPAIPIPRTLARMVFILYIVFLTVMLVRFARAWVRTREIRRHGFMVPACELSALGERRRSFTTEATEGTETAEREPPAQGGSSGSSLAAGHSSLPQLSRILTAASDRAGASILWSARVAGPVTVGARRPTIILPARLLDPDAGDDLSAALAHELAHVRRRDYLCNLVVELLVLPVAFHPLARTIKRQLAESRELACDELAASALGPASYARSLVRMAHQISDFATPAALRPDYTLGVFDADILEERVMTLLRPRASMRLAKCSLFAAALLIAASCMAAASFGLAAAHDQDNPNLLAFAGTWAAQFHAKTFCRLSLKPEDDHLTGTISMGEINLDAQGNVNQVVEEAGEAGPILGARTESGKLYFKQKDGEDTLSYEMDLSGPADARLRLLDQPPQGVAAPQPFTLHKEPNDGRAVVGGVLGGVPDGVANGVKGETIGGVPNGVSGEPSGVTVGGVIGGVPVAPVAGTFKYAGKEYAYSGQTSEAKTGGLSGIVVDASGARIPEAEVHLVSRNTSFQQSVKTDDAGNFSFADVPASRYTLEVTRSGMGAADRSFEFKAEGKAPYFPFVLHPGDVTESPVVTAKGPASESRATAAGPRKIRVGGEVMSAKLVEGTHVSPEYPEAARAKGIEGLVTLQATISAEGVPTDIRVMSSPDDSLSQAATDAVKQWRYQPTLLNGEPVEVVTTIAVDFRLHN